MKDSFDLDKLLFITRFIKPISIWDSSYHSHEIQYLSIDKTNENNKKKIRKIIIEFYLF